MLKKNKLLLTIFALVTVEASAVDCRLYNTRYFNENKSVASKEIICILASESSELASSKNCLMLKSKSCPFKNVVKVSEFETFVQEIGSPGFNLCHYLKGSPQLYQIEIQGKWTPFERCFWKNSKEFVEVDELIRFYKSL